MILCPVCKHDLSRVTDTRSQKKLFGIRRRRKCENCGESFSTLEISVISSRNLIRNGEAAIEAFETFSIALKKWKKDMEQ